MKRILQTTLKTKNLYESIGMQHPDGTLMCMTSTKKANWYLDRGLATRVSEDAVRLNFTPNGYGNSDNPYYLERKENICVVCGSAEKLTRHHVVPYQFRTLLPEQFKSHDHHDVLLVCRDCHDEYEIEADELREIVFYNIGFDLKESNRRRSHNSKVRSAKNTLRSIERRGNLNNIPPSRVEFLKEISERGYLEEAEDWKQLFIKKYVDVLPINEFCAMWRKHFIDIMKPGFLSPHFRVDHTRNE